MMREIDIVERLEKEEKVHIDFKVRDLNEKSLQYELSHERIQIWVS